jgi:hypothetical protein
VPGHNLAHEVNRIQGAIDLIIWFFLDVPPGQVSADTFHYMENIIVQATVDEPRFDAVWLWADDGSHRIFGLIVCDQFSTLGIIDVDLFMLKFAPKKNYTMSSSEPVIMYFEFSMYPLWM